MKILLSRISPSNTTGGAELSARDISRSLNDLGYESMLVTNLADSRVIFGIDRFEVIKFKNNIFYLLPLFFIFLRIIKKYRPDILFPQSRHDQIVLTLLGKLLNIPVVWRDPGDLVPQLTYPISGPLQNIYRKVQKKCATMALSIITLNNDYKNSIEELVGGIEGSRIVSIGSNINFDDYRPEEKNDNGDTVIFGTLSRLDENKGIQYAIEAIKNLPKKHKVKLYIAGDGPHKDALMDVAKDDNRIEFLGKYENVSEFISKIDVLIQPSLFEGWGRTVREAMYHGVAVIGSNTGGIKDQITHKKTGLLFEVGNIDELTLNIKYLLSRRDEIAKLSTNARQSVIYEGDWRSTVEKEYIPILLKAAKSVRIDVSSFRSNRQYSGVGYYTSMLTEEMVKRANVDEVTGLFGNSQQFLNKAYRKLVSWGLRVPFDVLKRKVDLTIFPDFSAWPSIKSKKTAVVVHDLTYIHYPEYLDKANLKHLQRVVPRSIHKSDLVITVSDSVKDEIVKIFKIDRNKVIVTPIPPNDRFYKTDKVIDIKEKYGIKESDYILFLGNIEPRKNIDTLLDSFVKLSIETKNKYALVIAGGNGWNSESTQVKIKELSNMYPIYKAGYVDSLHIPNLYNQAKVFVIPSHYEGFGMGVVESLASGTQVIASNIPSLRQAGGSVVEYFNPNSSEDLYQKLTAALNRRGQKDYSEHLSKFSWEHNIDKILEQLDLK